ncbi:DUF6290 family protein [Companilactobacillus muriivasis]|uniref:DUF6290 family protein n=1 Tax=Companilactobacillus muriivasis TaxID=3081444 RepID=UPI0030C757C5
MRRPNTIVTAGSITCTLRLRLTKIRSLQIDTDLNTAIDDYLKVTGQDFNSFAEMVLAEKLEDLIDLKDYLKAIENDDGTRLTMNDAFKELELPQ